MNIAPNEHQARTNWSRGEILDVALIALQIAILFLTRIYQVQRYSDDAFIHFRCSLHLSQGEGMVFNPGEWVLGTTSPVWSFLLGILHIPIPIPIPSLAEWLNFGIEIGITLLALRWFRRVGMGIFASHAAALLLNLEHWRMFFSSTGLELSFFILAFMLVFEFLQTRKWLAAGLVLGVIGWIRPEGSLVWISSFATLLIGAVAVYLSGQRDSLPGNLKLLFKSFGVATAIALLIAAILTYCYGSPLPHSMMAKSRAPWFQVGGELSQVMFFIRLGNLTPAYPIMGFEAIWGRTPDNLNSIVIASVQVGLMLAGVWRLRRSGQTILAPTLLFFSLGYYLFYAILRPPIFEWYYIPHFFVSLLLSCIGWFALFQALRNWLAEKSRMCQRLAPPIAHLAFALILLLSARSLAHQAYRSGRLTGESAIESLRFRFRPLTITDKNIMYIRFADQMLPTLRLHPEVSVACTEIGIFGYYFGGHVLDNFALVSPEVLNVTDPAVLATLPETCRSHPMNIWMSHRPEVIMSDWRWMPKLPTEFHAEYEEAPWNATRLAVFVRRDFAPKIVVE